MPIGDLLASISGGKPAASNTQPAPQNPPKRKAEDDPRPAAKVPRKTPPPLSKPIPRPAPRPVDRPNGAQRPANGPAPKSTPPVRNGANGAPRPVKPPTSSAAPTDNSASAPKVPPKKGSFAEILARAKKAQESMGQVGKIQHRKVDKKEKSPGLKPEPRAPGKKPAASTGYQGTARAGQKPAGPGSSAASKTAPRGKPGASRASPTAREKEKEAQEAARKIKKAAMATTGYQGTARPRPGTNKPQKDQHRGGALLNRQPHRSGGSRGAREQDEYDEELDDFIEYDDDEDDQGGPRYEYDSDGSSDMEAGIDELTGEERMAERIARREDIEQERLEREHKMAKEERKRKALEALRSKRR